MSGLFFNLPILLSKDNEGWIRVLYVCVFGHVSAPLLVAPVSTHSWSTLITPDISVS